MDDQARVEMRYELGFTLIELMVAMGMAIFFITATMTLADMSNQSYRAQERVSDAQQNIRAAMDLMVRDIRMAGFDPLAISKGRTAGIGIVVAEQHLLQITADLDADGEISNGREDMTYFYEAGTRRLRQKEGGGAFAQTFIEGVSGLSFTYLRADGTPSVDLDDITMIVVTMTVEDRNHKGGTFKRTLTTRINCRNLRLSN